MEEIKISLDTAWVVICTAMIFLMNLGFAFLESGFCQSKNTVSILTKNLAVLMISLIAYWMLGFGIQYSQGGLVGTSGFFLLGADNSPKTGVAYIGIFSALSSAGVPLSAKFLFQSASTAATIVSGAVAERVRLIVFLIFSLLYVPFGFSVAGHWAWGGGWLSQLGYYDFAGSSVVHVVGGCGALVGAWMLGPRIGKSSSESLPAHNLTFATLGACMLWFGWFGFNSGSTLSAVPAISNIALTTNLAAAFGGLSGFLYSWSKCGKPDLSALINGSLGALVAITASCAYVSPLSAAIIGVVAGILVLYSINFIDKVLKIDDPVGAVGVHFTGGSVGILATGIFAEGSKFGIEPAPTGMIAGDGIRQLGVQALGLLSISITSLMISFIIWSILKSLFGLRVPKSSEIRGLDESQHDSIAYNFTFNPSLNKE
jgi:ammonium transporter, Amt family